MSLSGHPSGRQEFHQAKQLVGCLLERMGKIDSDCICLNYRTDCVELSLKLKGGTWMKTALKASHTENYADFATQK